MLASSETTIAVWMVASASTRDHFMRKIMFEEMEIFAISLNKVPDSNKFESFHEILGNWWTLVLYRKITNF